jgi:hypothetical protein
VVMSSHLRRYIAGSAAQQNIGPAQVAIMEAAGDSGPLSQM